MPININLTLNKFFYVKLLRPLMIKLTMMRFFINLKLSFSSIQIIRVNFDYSLRMLHLTVHYTIYIQNNKYL